MKWFRNYNDPTRHPQYGQFQAEEEHAETLDFIRQHGRNPYYHYERASIIATAKSRAKERVRQLRSFDNE